MEFLTAPEWTTLLMEIPMQILQALHLTPVMVFPTVPDFESSLFILYAHHWSFRNHLNCDA